MLANAALVAFMELLDSDRAELNGLKCICPEIWGQDPGKTSEATCPYHRRRALINQAEEALMTLKTIHIEARPPVPYDMEYLHRRLARLGQLRRESTPGNWRLMSLGADWFGGYEELVSENSQPILERDGPSRFVSELDLLYVTETRRILPEVLDLTLQMVQELYRRRQADAPPETNLPYEKQERKTNVG